jgi:acetone carboxylase gamma subunit
VLKEIQTYDHSNIISMGNYLVKSKKGSFWWRDVLKLLDTYKGNGRNRENYSILIGHVEWENTIIILPTTAFLLKLRRYHSLSEILSQDSFHDLFNLSKRLIFRLLVHDT